MFCWFQTKPKNRKLLRSMDLFGSSQERDTPLVWLDRVQGRLDLPLVLVLVPDCLDCDWKLQKK